MVLAGPVWLGKLVPPLIAWALSNPVNPSARIALLVSAGSGFFFRAALDELSAIYNRKLVATAVITDADRTTKADASKIAAFAQALQAQALPA